jgi:hypothetical protein
MNSNRLTISIAVTVEASSPRGSTDARAFIVKTISHPNRFTKCRDYKRVMTGKPGLFNLQLKEQVAFSVG